MFGLLEAHSCLVDLSHGKEKRVQKNNKLIILKKDLNMTLDRKEGNEKCAEKLSSTMEMASLGRAHINWVCSFHRVRRCSKQKS